MKDSNRYVWSSYSLHKTLEVYMFCLNVMIGLGRHWHTCLPDSEAEAQIYGVAKVVKPGVE